MKFRFVGDLDCPDWVLAEIATISKISSIKAKQLCVLIAQSMINIESLQNERIAKLASDTKLELNDIKACIALIEFILTSAANHHVSGEILNSELQQLGLPKEHSTSICKVYDENEKKLQELLLNKSLKLNKLNSLTWRVDYIYASNYLKNINEPLANLKFQIKDAVDENIKSKIVTMDKTDLKLLIHEMKEAKKLMDSI